MRYHRDLLPEPSDYASTSCGSTDCKPEKIDFEAEGRKIIPVGMKLWKATDLYMSTVGRL